MSTDRELLELAAKAAGLECRWEWRTNPNGGRYEVLFNVEAYTDFEPLTDDGDALRLAVRLRIPVRYTRRFTDGEEEGLSLYEIRRAIVRAAAEIGRAMP